MCRIEEMVPAVRSVARRFALAVRSDPDDCASAAMLRVIEVLHEKPNVAWAYLWKVALFSMRTYAFEDNTIRVPHGSGVNRMERHPRAVTPTSHDRTMDLKGVEINMLHEGYTKEEISVIMGVSPNTVARRLKEQWNDNA